MGGEAYVAEAGPVSHSATDSAFGAACALSVSALGFDRLTGRVGSSAERLPAAFGSAVVPAVEDAAAAR